MGSRPWGHKESDTTERLHFLGTDPGLGQTYLWITGFRSQGAPGSCSQLFSAQGASGCEKEGGRREERSP